MAEKTMTDEDFDLAVGHVTSFYQSARAKAKKQVAHWMGKFMIVKAENYTLRRKIRNAENLCINLAESEKRSGIKIGQLSTQVDHHREMEAKNGTEVVRLKLAAGTALKEWDKKDDEIKDLKQQVADLKEGVLV
jgi:hypothetical protein